MRINYDGRGVYKIHSQKIQILFVHLDCKIWHPWIKTLHLRSGNLLWCHIPKDLPLLNKIVDYILIQLSPKILNTWSLKQFLFFFLFIFFIEEFIDQEIFHPSSCRPTILEMAKSDKKIKYNSTNIFFFFFYINEIYICNKLTIKCT